jgi:hypothetical integral membrane protein (TIGR02206 family)
MFSTFFLGRQNPRLLESGPYAPYSLAHIAVAAAAFALVFSLVRRVRRTNHGVRLRWVWGAYALMALLDVARFAWEMNAGDFNLRESLPLQLCGLQLIAIPIALAGKSCAGEYARDFVFAYGTLGFVLAVLMPFTVMYDYPVWHFRTMQSMLYHASLGFAALMLPHLGYRPDVKNACKGYLVLICAALLTGIVNAALGSNYLYTARLPLPGQIVPWPYYLPLLLLFILLAGRLPYYAYHIAKTHASDKTAITNHSA